MKFLLKLVLGIVLNALALYLLTLVVHEITYTGGYSLFIAGGIVIGILNLIVKPVLKLVSLPLIFLTGGLFLIVINAFILWFLSYILSVAQFRDLSLVFPNLGSYVIGAIVFGVINAAEHLLIKY